MSLDNFLAHFTGVRVQMNWMALADSNPEVRSFELTCRDSLGQLFTPWRQNLDGSYADGNIPDAIPLRISAQPFPVPIEDQIKKGISDDIINMSVPCYCLGNAGYLILDGNHRLASLYRSERKFKIAIWAIQGPICRDILPDLECWKS